MRRGKKIAANSFYNYRKIKLGDVKKYIKLRVKKMSK